MVAIAPVDPIFDHMRAFGIAMWNGGWTAAQWTTDDALAIMGVSRDEAEHVTEIVGGLIGFGFEHEHALLFLGQWQAYAERGAFKGPWDNRDGLASSDLRCLGHRHDQTVASVIASRMGVELISAPQWFSYWRDSPPFGKDVIMVAKGI